MNVFAQILLVLMPVAATPTHRPCPPAVPSAVPLLVHGGNSVGPKVTKPIAGMKSSSRRSSKLPAPAGTPRSTRGGGSSRQPSPGSSLRVDSFRGQSGGSLSGRRSSGSIYNPLTAGMHISPGNASIGARLPAAPASIGARLPNPPSLGQRVRQSVRAFGQRVAGAIRRGFSGLRSRFRSSRPNVQASHYQPIPVRATTQLGQSGRMSASHASGSGHYQAFTFVSTGYGLQGYGAIPTLSMPGYGVLPRGSSYRASQASGSYGQLPASRESSVFGRLSLAKEGTYGVLPQAKSSYDKVPTRTSGYDAVPH